MDRKTGRGEEMEREKPEMGDRNGFKRPGCFQTDRKRIPPPGPSSQTRDEGQSVVSRTHVDWEQMV